MTRYNPFRVSFDGPLATRERTWAQVAATLIGGVAIVLAATGTLALLNASSGTLGAWSNAQLARDGDDPAGKPCDQQTWPYIEQRCLKHADPKSSERSTPKHGLSSERVTLPGAPVAGGTQQPDAKPAREPGTTGAAPRVANAGQDAASAPKPARAVRQTPAHAVGTDAARQRHGAEPRLSLREQRRARREERLRREARRARAEAREETRRARDDRTVRRWTEESYDLPPGGDRRVIVIPRGPFDDGFFPAMR